MILPRFAKTLSTAALLATVCAASASGQVAHPKWKDCVNAIPDSDLRRVPEFLASDADDSTPSLLKTADLLVDSAAERVRIALGGTPRLAPKGEPLITWRNIHSTVHVTVHSSGEFSWVVSEDSVTDTTELRGVRLVARALHDLKSEGRRPAWPDSAKGDSATFRMFFVAPAPAKDGTLAMVNARYGAPVFSLAVPWEEPVSVKRQARTIYPAAPRRGAAESSIEIDFKVDENGNVDPSSIHDIRSPDAPTYTGDLAEYYRLFVKAAKTSIEKSQYRARKLAGCAVPQLVRQPFEFAINR